MNFRDHHRKELGMCPKGNQAMEKYQAGEGARGIRTWIFPSVTTEVIVTIAFSSYESSLRNLGHFKCQIVV